MFVCSSGTKGLPFSMPIDCIVCALQRSEYIERFMLHQSRKQLEIANVVGKQEVIRSVGAVEKLHGWRRGSRRKRINPGLFNECHRLIGLVVDLKAAHKEHDRVGRRSHSEITVGNVAGVAGRQYEELAASAL